MSGENYRIVLGEGECIRYRSANSEKEARGLAADAIHRGNASQVAIEENKNGTWAHLPAVKQY